MDNDLDQHILLSEDISKEELVDEILKQREVIKSLEEKIKELEKDKKEKSSVKKIKSKLKPRRYWKKLGRPEGHPGSTRAKPSEIDRVVEETLSCCPECGSKNLTEAPSLRSEHIQEDLIPARVEATKFIHHAYWCECCQTIQKASYAPEEIPCSYLGPNILMQTVLMKYHLGVSYAKIQRFFEDFCQLKVTDSALVQALQRISRWLNVEENVILEAIRASPYLHIDETGWKIAGINHWLWDFVNKKLALYKIRRSRGRDVPKEILSQEYAGVVISDFLSAYDKSGSHRQRCLVHLKREMHKIKEQETSQHSRKAYHRLNRILKDAFRLDRQRKQLEVHVFLRRLHKLENRLLSFACDLHNNKEWHRIANRLLKYYEEILTFLKMKDLPHHNNHAERMIRPNVIFRKISFQNMSPKGSRAHEVLMSILQTLRLQKIDPIEFFKESYLAHRKGDPIPHLVL